MPIVNFHEELKIETVAELIEKLDAIEVKPNDICDLYFSSPGGSAAAMEMLLDYLNKNNHWFLICVEEFSSCGFILFCRYEGNKYFTSQANSVVHLLGYSEHTRERLKDKDNHKRAEKNLKNDNDELLAMLELLELPKALFDRVKRGEDIILYYEDLTNLKWAALSE